MIHKTAIIDNKAKVSSSANIGPYSVIGPNVEIGEDVIIHSHVNISGNTIIGNSNKIYPFASIGNDPQDLKYNGEKTKLIIGNNNKKQIFREFTSMNKASDAIVWVLSFCIALVAVYTAAFGIIDEIYQRSITVAVSLIVAIFGSSLAKLHEAESQKIKIGQWIIDFVLILLVVLWIVIFVQLHKWDFLKILQLVR